MMRLARQIPGPPAANGHPGYRHGLEEHIEQGQEASEKLWECVRQLVQEKK